jgi:peptide-methionine (S)-S-oxide reductase
MEKATFAAGCFWGVEEAFRQTPGVVKTTVGYTGGAVPDPTYEQVCTGATGHAEAVLVEYDPALITYYGLLQVFWETHDPTTRDRQGPDIGSQYRSAIFFHTSEQEKEARLSVAQLEQEERYGSPIVTQIVPADSFYRAEEYHQQYIAKRGGGMRCH